MPIASLTTGEIETKAMGPEFGAGHFLSAPYFQVTSSTLPVFLIAASSPALNT
jgi:hypothetical protein